VVFADFSKNDQAQPAIPQGSDDDLARLVVRVPGIRENPGQRIIENGDGLLKLDTVLRAFVAALRVSHSKIRLKGQFLLANSSG
jgi:hypothetical protein